MKFSHLPITFCLSDKNIVFSAFFSYSFILRSYLMAINQVLHLYKASRKNIILWEGEYWMHLA